MPVVKIVPFPGQNGKSAYEIAVDNGFEGTEQEWLDSLGGGNADIADFTFTYDDDGPESFMTIHNHDMSIRTTRDDNQDADISINSADDVWITANDTIELTSATDEVRIISGINEQRWNFQPDGLITSSNDVVGIESLSGGDVVKGRLKFEPNNGRALLQAYGNNQTATFTDSWDTATWTAIDSQSGLTLTNASSIISFMDATGYQVDNLKISVNGSYYAPYNGASSGDGAITFYIEGLMPPEGEFTLIELAFQYAFSSKVDIDFDEGDLLIETEDEMDIVISAADDLYLRANGDDVFIEANNDINFTANTDGSQQSWRMDIDGKLQFPAAGYIENIFGDSGDGYGNDTFKIVPDADLQSDQYLIIDPTSPNHIHIRAGGEIDDSAAELIIGGERTHIAAVDGFHEVRISTGSTININSYLNINTQGNTNFVAESGPVIVEVGYTVEVDGVEYVVDSVAPDTPAPGNVMISASGAVFNFGQAYTFRGDDGTNSQWLFAADGTLYGPGGEGEVLVSGIASGPTTETLTVFSEGSMEITADGGDMNFYMDGAAYIGPSTADNRIAQMKDITDRVSSVVPYTSTWSGTGLTYTSDPVTAYYVKIGNLVQVQVSVDFTNVTNFGTGSYSITLPFNSAFHTDAFGGSVHNTGSTTEHWTLKAHLSPASDVATLWYIATTGQDEVFDHNSPISLNTTDKFHMSFSYICE